jgi:hypothetical protein
MRLLTLAKERRYKELSTELMRSESRASAGDLLPELETLGDQDVAAKRWQDAAKVYQLALFCATIVVQTKPSAWGDSNPVELAMARLSDKLVTTAAGFSEQQKRGNLEWDSGTTQLIDLAKAGRLEEAVDLLRRLDGLSDPGGRESTACARRLEIEARRLPLDSYELGRWFLERAIERYRRTGDEEDADRLTRLLSSFQPPAPAPRDLGFEELIQTLEPLVREGRKAAWYPLIRNRKDRLMAERFVALGDENREARNWFAAQECYLIASEILTPVAKVNTEFFSSFMGRLGEVIGKLMDQRIANPFSGSVPEVPDWDRGLALAESLVLAERFGDADEIMRQLLSLHDTYQGRNWELLSRWELIGDHLIQNHPEMARWFYERFAFEAWAMPVDNAYQGQVQDGIEATARSKVSAATERIPPREALIEAVLSARGQGLRPSPETYLKNVEDGGLLKLVPERELYASYRKPSEMISYHFQVRIQGSEIRLSQRQDEYGRVSPYSFGDQLLGVELVTPEFRMKPGIPVVIAYNVPGGGPAWSLKLQEIRARR